MWEEKYKTLLAKNPQQTQCIVGLMVRTERDVIERKEREETEAEKDEKTEKMGMK